MGLFDKFSKEQIKNLRTDTSNFFIGSPEAEAESTYTSKVKLNEVFEDFLEVIPKLNTEKFIISGRKGCGKSALAENLLFLSDNEAEYFCDFIKKSDIDIEKITQITSQSDNGISQELLIEWIILIKFVKQLIQNEALSSQIGINDLKIFLKKNSGFIDIKSNQIEEVLQSKGWEINVEHFKRFMTAKFGNRFDIKSGKAPFYKLLPHLKDTVKELFKDPLNKHNNFILIFDDLDIGFNSKNENNIKTLLNIIRVVRDYNIGFIGKSGVNAKIILLLREDISRVLLNEDADTAKIFSSYEIPLKWYEHEKSTKGENQLKIKQFINKRIALNFETNSFDFDSENPWESLIENDSRYSKSSFRYVADHTLIRPRDFILFFKPLSELKLPIPLTYSDINILVGKYAIEFVSELRNELSAHYNPKEIESILRTFNNCHTENVSFIIFANELSKFGFTGDPLELLDLLFDLSIIGNISEAGLIYFKHWEKDDELFSFNSESKIVLHFSLRNYCKRKRN